MNFKEEDLIGGTWTVRTPFKPGALISVLPLKMFWGKPRTRWQDVIQRDTSQILGVRGWRRRAEDREEWRRLLMDASARRNCR